MVKRAWLMLALALAVAGLKAAFLPFQLDPPKHDNPVDPLNPKNLSRLFGTPRPTSTPPPSPTASPSPTPVRSATPSPTASPSPTPVLPQLADELPLNHATVNLPFVAEPVTQSNAGQWELTLRFNMDMDTTTFPLAGAVVFAPPADVILKSSTARSATYVLNTTNGGGSHPLAVGTAYTVSVSSVIHAATGVPLVPATLNYTTGPFALATLLTGNFSGYADGVLYPEVINEPPSSWEPLVGAVFNAPINTSVLPSNQIQCSPNIIANEMYNNQGAVTDINMVSLAICGAVPSTPYTFSYTGGITDRNGNTAAPVGGMLRTSEPLRAVGYQAPPDTQYLVVNFNYPLDAASGAAAGTVVPSPGVGFAVFNPGCLPNSTPGNSQAPGYAYVSNGGPTFSSGVTYTATISTALMDSTDSANLATPWSVTFYQP
jgi:hypothetical protein